MITSPTPIALVTAAEARSVDEDLVPIAAACRAHGLAVEVVDWDDPSIDWAGFARVVVRSTWDYTSRLDEFLAWVERVDRVAELHNPASVLRWNTDKRYLLDLAGAGVDVVDSRFAGPGEAVAFPDAAELVVKPSVSSGSRDTARYRADQLDAAAAHVAALHAAGRTAMVQPYLADVDRAGEAALICLGGAVSHAITKAALLRPDEPPSRALFAPEHIEARDPSPDEVDAALRTLEAISNLPRLGLAGRVPLYARIDLLRDDAGRLRVLEAELTEPSLFVERAPGSAARFAAAVAELG